MADESNQPKDVEYLEKVRAPVKPDVKPSDANRTPKKGGSGDPGGAMSPLQSARQDLNDRSGSGASAGAVDTDGQPGTLADTPDDAPATTRARDTDIGEPLPENLTEPEDKPESNDQHHGRDDETSSQSDEDPDEDGADDDDGDDSRHGGPDKPKGDEKPGGAEKGGGKLAGGSGGAAGGAEVAGEAAEAARAAAVAAEAAEAAVAIFNPVTLGILLGASVLMLIFALIFAPIAVGMVQQNQSTQTADSSGGGAPAGGGSDVTCEKLTGTPKDIIDNVALPIARKIAFQEYTPEFVEAKNAAHSAMTTSGNTSDHAGPPDIRWAADISNSASAAEDESATTPEMDQLAKDLASCFGFPPEQWRGDCNTLAKDGYSIQLIYRTTCGGNHWNHVHIGVNMGG